MLLTKLIEPFCKINLLVSKKSNVSSISKSMTTEVED
jgi:hypothetical protein